MPINVENSINKSKNLKHLKDRKKINSHNTNIQKIFFLRSDIPVVYQLPCRNKFEQQS